MKNIIIVTLGVLLIATVFFAIEASAQGAILVSLENKAADLQSQNQELSDNLVAATSLSQINKEATNMGMARPEKFVYLTQQGIALRGADQVVASILP